MLGSQDGFNSKFAAFLTYGGIFDQKNRVKLLDCWSERLNTAGIGCKKLCLSTYLSSTDERIEWSNHQLPSDDLCQQNAVILKRTSRYPLIIDPSGQALVYLKSHLGSKNLQITSFRDPQFLKTLESSLRFGNPLIIEDAESYDSIMNNILNKEVRKSGGRNLCKLGKKDVDYQPTFMMFLITKTARDFSPDICSRVTFVNFTVTNASLQVQCLDKLMFSQRPDIDQKRKDLTKMQGEYQFRLHTLEKALLKSLNNSTGNILDDENVMKTLEVLKQEACEIEQKVKETDIILEEVERVIKIYRPLSSKLSNVYFSIEQLSKIQKFYQFDLIAFFEQIDKVLNQNLEESKIEGEMFLEIQRQVSMMLREEDLFLFLVLMAQIKEKDSLCDEYEWTFFLTGTAIGKVAVIDDLLIQVFGGDIASVVENLCLIGSFSKLKDLIKKDKDSWRGLLSCDDPELNMVKLTQGIFY
jgi:dynein heavy chain 1